jgi:hypothetical protein
MNSPSPVEYSPLTLAGEGLGERAGRERNPSLKDTQGFANTFVNIWCICRMRLSW